MTVMQKSRNMKIFRNAASLLLFAATAMLASCDARKDAAPAQTEGAPMSSFADATGAAPRDNRQTARAPFGPGLPRATKRTNEKMLWRKAYTCSFNTDRLVPNWVAWELTDSHTNGRYLRKQIPFQEDEGVTTFDYMRSGFDRGHMCPSGDNKWDRTAQQECFLLTNVCPQNHNLNAGDWNDLEIQCRTWARRYGKICIVTGPIFESATPRRIRRKVAVPDAFYKVVYCPSRQMAVGFICRNKSGHRRLSDYAVAVDQVERVTGLDFFPNLPDDIERRVEADGNASRWFGSRS